MKKLLALTLTLIMVLTLVACGDNQSTTTTTITVTPGEPELVQARRITKLTSVVPHDWGDEYFWSREYQYTGLGVTAHQEGEIVFEYAFHPNGQVKSEVWHNFDTIVTHIYDEQGNLIEMIECDSTGEEISHSQFEHNADGLVTKQTTWTDGDTVVETYTYDKNGEILEWVETTNGEETARDTYRYNEAGKQLEGKSYENGELVYSSTRSFDDNGNLLENRTDHLNYEGESWYSYESYVYDETGRMVSSHQEGDDPANFWDFDVTYIYDEAGNLIAEEYVHDYEGTITDTYTYDEDGNLIQRVTHSHMDGWITNTESYTYDAEGRVLEVRCLTEYEDGTVMSESRETFVYDEAGRELECAWYDQDEETMRRAYQYDSNGNRISMEYYEEGELSYAYTCHYDEDGKLTDVSCAGAESLAEDGAELIAQVDEEGEVTYLAVVYENVTVTKDEAQQIERINAYLIG